MNRRQQEADFRRICLDNGWRFTRQRFLVYAFMHGNRTHPRVDDVWFAVRKELPKVTRESVFRILSEFAEHGMIARIDQMGIAQFDCNAAPHGHLSCVRCGRTMDIELPPDLCEALPTKAFSVRTVLISGICEKCAKRGI